MTSSLHGIYQKRLLPLVIPGNEQRRSHKNIFTEIYFLSLSLSLARSYVWPYVCHRPKVKPP